MDREEVVLEVKPGESREKAFSALYKSKVQTTASEDVVEDIRGIADRRREDPWMRQKAEAPPSPPSPLQMTLHQGVDFQRAAADKAAYSAAPGMDPREEYGNPWASGDLPSRTADRPLPKQKANSSNREFQNPKQEPTKEGGWLSRTIDALER